MAANIGFEPILSEVSLTIPLKEITREQAQEKFAVGSEETTRDIMESKYLSLHY
jgi:hypothetical protein